MENKIELYKHNKQTYEKMIEMFKTLNRVGSVQPTGSGKSFLILKWIEDNKDNKIIVLSPSNDIFDQLYKYSSHCPEILDNVEMYTYSKIINMDNEDICKLEVDKIIIDEFHRIGADIWGQKVQLLLESHPNSKIFGVTATPVRNDGKDMVDEIFNNNLAREMYLGEAVYLGILPEPEYISAYYEKDQELYYVEKLEQLTSDKEREEFIKNYEYMVKNIQKSQGIEETFKTYLSDGIGKFIVFCNNNEHLQECMESLKYWFKDITDDIHFYISTSDQPDKDKQLKDFIDDKSDTIRLMMSINRLNEGLHAPGIDGVIMLRKTTSPIIYLQQMGRALAAKKDKEHDKKPLIFDFVNNYASATNAKFTRPRKSDDYDKTRSLLNKYIERTENLESEFNENGIIKETKLETFDNEEEKLLRELDSKLSDETKEKLVKNKNNPFYIDFITAAVMYGEPNKEFIVYDKAMETNDFINKLNDLLDYDRDDKWNDAFELLKEFVNEFRRFPSSGEKYKDNNIGNWCKRQRYEYKQNNLNPDRIEKLKSIGFKFEYEDPWYKRFKILEEFVNEFGRLPSSNEKYKNDPIGSWCSTQRYEYKQEKLIDEKIELLKSIGFRFENLDQWYDNFNDVKKFVDINNRFPTYTEKYKDNNIGKWCSTQRYEYKQNNLNPDRIEKLKSIGFKFEYEDPWLAKWYKRFKILEEFVNEFGRLPKRREKYKNDPIGSFLNTQIYYYSEGKLTYEKIELLKSVGVKFKKD